MPEIVIMGMGNDSPKVTLPMNATKEQIIGALLATGTPELEAKTDSVCIALDDYLNSLERDLEVELDLHGGRTILARDLRTLIVATKKEIDYINKKELDFINKHLEGVKK